MKLSSGQREFLAANPDEAGQAFANGQMNECRAQFVRYCEENGYQSDGSAAVERLIDLAAAFAWLMANFPTVSELAGMEPEA